jgi:hypothetical protein
MSSALKTVPLRVLGPLVVSFALIGFRIRLLGPRIVSSVGVGSLGVYSFSIGLIVGLLTSKTALVTLRAGGLFSNLG